MKKRKGIGRERICEMLRSVEGWCLTPRRNINSPQLQLGNNQTKVKPARDTNEGQASDIRRQEGARTLLE